MTPPERDHIVGAFSFELANCESDVVVGRMLENLANVDAELCARVAEQLGEPAPKGKPAQDAGSSPALSMMPAGAGPDRRPGRGRDRRRRCRPERDRRARQVGWTRKTRCCTSSRRTAARSRSRPHGKTRAHRAQEPAHRAIGRSTTRSWSPTGPRSTSSRTTRSSGSCSRRRTDTTSRSRLGPRTRRARRVRHPAGCQRRGRRRPSRQRVQQRSRGEHGLAPPLGPLSSSALPVRSQTCPILPNSCSRPRPPAMRTRCGQSSSSHPNSATSPTRWARTHSISPPSTTTRTSRG